MMVLVPVLKRVGGLQKEKREVKCEAIGERRTHWLSVHATGKKDKSCEIITYEGPLQSIIKGTEK